MESRDRYQDMLALPRPAPRTHPRMPRANRAAQFAPFAALAGYDAEILEASRLTEPRQLLSEDALALLDQRQALLEACAARRPKVTVTYFLPDARKDGGSYAVYTGRLRRVDACEGTMIFADGRKIALENVCALESPLFRERPEEQP